jgi:ubiquinone/menaquinone biosynthesis C-methylase UbiE
MYFGLPILTSDRDFAHHLCADAATYFDPLDADSVARAMARIIDDEELRQGLVENGRRILAQAPTWNEIAARFVDVLERTAKAHLPINAVPEHQRANNYVPVSPGWQAPSAAKGLLPLGSQTPQARWHASLSGKGESEASTANDVRTLFNQKARRWQSKYGQGGKLNFRLQQFTGRLSALFRPPGNILDLGCGTGEITTAIGHRGYHVTACDIAEEMIDVARSSHPGSVVEWVRLDPDWEVLPFADNSFDGIVVSSVFEYLDDVPRVATELSRVLRPEGVLLLTVPNPCNFVRRLEAWLQWMPLVQQLSSALRRVQRIDSYAAYLRLSRNRFEAQGWQSVLSAAHFTPLDERDFSQETWRHQAGAPLVLLAVKRVATGGSGQFDADEALCRPLAM